MASSGSREGATDDAAGDLYGAADSGEAKPRKRQDFTWSQISVLEHVFETNPLPRQALIQELSKRLSLPPRTTQVWFQNRRQKWRAMHHAWGQPAPLLKNAANRTTSLEKLLPDLKDKPIPPPPRPPPVSSPTDFTPPPPGVMCVPVGMQGLMLMSSAPGQVMPAQMPGALGQIMGPPPPCPVPMPMVGPPVSGASPQGFQVMPPGAIPGMPPGLIQGMVPDMPQGAPAGPVLPQAGPPPNLPMPMPHPLDRGLMLPPPLPPSVGGAPFMPSPVPPVPAPLAEALKKVHRPTKRALVAAQRLALAAAAKASISESDFAAAQPTALAPAALAAAILAEASAGISPGCSAAQMPNEGMDAAAEAAAVIAAAEAAEAAEMAATASAAASMPSFAGCSATQVPNEGMDAAAEAAAVIAAAEEAEEAEMAATTNGKAANSSTPYEVASTSAPETEGGVAAVGGAAEGGAANGSAAAAIGPPHNERGLAPARFVGMRGAQPLLAIAADEQYGLRTVSMPSTGELSCLPNGALALKVSQSTSLLYLPHSHLTPYAFPPGTAGVIDENQPSSKRSRTTSDAPAAGTMLEQPSHAPAMPAQPTAVTEHPHEMATSAQ